jgi:hypothetical protein
MDSLNRYPLLIVLISLPFSLFVFFLPFLSSARLAKKEDEEALRKEKRHEEKRRRKLEKAATVRA